jgi:hypothetical protein
MDLTAKEKLLIFALGIYLKNLEKKVKAENLEISIQKSVFIDFVLKTKLFEKKERALYKNLENLEEKKLLSYPYHRILLTEKGWKDFLKIEGEVKPYLMIQDTLNKTNLVKETRRIQTVFKW